MDAFHETRKIFVSFYGGEPDFAFMAPGPGQRLEGTYVITVANR